MVMADADNCVAVRLWEQGEGVISCLGELFVPCVGPGVGVGGGMKDADMLGE